MKAAAPSPQLSPSAALSRLCYAELYCGLYYEALGETARAKELLVKAAAAFPAGDYMGDTARVHVKLRGWTSVPAKP